VFALADIVTVPTPLVADTPVTATFALAVFVTLPTEAVAETPDTLTEIDLSADPARGALATG
jgi:hypothetical protein